jgi:predicted nucleic acid-binding protein
LRAGEQVRHARCTSPTLKTPPTARRFFTDVDAGRYVPAPVAADVLHRAIEIDAQHADLGLGLVDASVVAVADAVDAATLATLDHAHLRPPARGRFDLLPEEATL